MVICVIAVLKSTIYGSTGSSSSIESIVVFNMAILLFFANIMGCTKLLFFPLSYVFDHGFEWLIPTPNVNSHHLDAMVEQSLSSLTSYPRKDLYIIRLPVIF